MYGSYTRHPHFSFVGGQRVLVVDDEPDILESLSTLLESSIDGVAVETVLSGEAGLQAIEDHHLDLVISDFKMPGMDGLEFLRRASKTKPELPRILMTAFPDLQIAVDAINQASIETFFAKPLDPAEVVDVVAKSLSKRKDSIAHNRAFARAMAEARKQRTNENS